MARRRRWSEYPARAVPARSTYLAVVPAYNESATLRAVLEDLARDAPAWDVIVIDDGSTDDSAEIARRAGAPVLRMPFNLGIGGAVQAGFVYALEHGYDRMVQVDGDGQHLPEELEKLEAAMDARPDCDMIVGSRFLDPEHHYLSPVSRRTGIHIFAFILSRLVGRPVTDPTSGFRLYNRRAIALFARDYPHDYPEVEAVLMVHRHRLTMSEVSVLMRERGGGASSITSGRSAYYMLKVTLALFIGMARARPVPDPGEPAAVRAEHGL